MAEVSAFLKKEGMLPFTNFNRVHVLPPCNISDADAMEGLELIDAALDLADKHVTD